MSQPRNGGKAAMNEKRAWLWCCSDSNLKQYLSTHCWHLDGWHVRGSLDFWWQPDCHSPCSSPHQVLMPAPLALVLLPSGARVPVLGVRIAHAWIELSQLGPDPQDFCYSNLGPDPTPHRANQNPPPHTPHPPQLLPPPPPTRHTSQLPAHPKEKHGLCSCQI